jgi:hypothetical protein
VAFTVLVSSLEYGTSGASMRPAFEFARSTGLAGLSHHLSGGVVLTEATLMPSKAVCLTDLVYLPVGAISTQPWRYVVSVGLMLQPRDWHRVT